MPMGVGHDATSSLDVAAPVTSIRVVSGPSRPYAPLADGADRRGARSATCRSTTCRWCNVDAGARARRRCATCSSSTRRAPTRAPGGRSRASGRCSVQPRRAPAARRRARSRSAAASRSPFTSTSWRSRAAARSCSAPCSSSSSPATSSINSFTETVLRSAEPRGDQPMGAAVGRAADALAFLAALAEAPYRYDFYQTLRRLECLYADQPRWGEAPAARRRAGAPRPGSGPVVRARAARVVRRPARRRPPRLQVRLFGLLGPNGPLPLHLTEYARERLRHAGDPTLSRFLDLFHHRFLALFYRAWAQAQPHVNRDRPDDDRFCGLRRRRSSGLLPPACRHRDARAGPREALPRRRARPAGAERRGPRRTIAAALLPRAGARSRSSSATGWRSARASARTSGATAPRSAPAPCSAGRSGTGSTSSASTSGR